MFGLGIINESESAVVNHPTPVMTACQSRQFNGLPAAS